MPPVADPCSSQACVQSTSVAFGFLALLVAGLGLVAAAWWLRRRRPLRSWVGPALAASAGLAMVYLWATAFLTSTGHADDDGVRVACPTAWEALSATDGHGDRDLSASERRCKHLAARHLAISAAAAAALAVVAGGVSSVVFRRHNEGLVRRAGGAATAP